MLDHRNAVSYVARPMSTNFYLEQDICVRCGRADRRHIGVRVNGGFHFSGVEHRSWAEWRAELLGDPHAEVVDEYGQYCPAKQFVIMVDMLSPAEVREESSRQMASLRMARTLEDSFWLDSRGFLFVTYEFC